MGGGSSYHADLKRYFESPAIELETRRATIASVTAFLHEPTWGRSEISARLEQGERLLTQVMNHVVYCRLRDSRDVTDKDAKACETEMNRNYDLLQSYINSELQADNVRTLSDAEADKLDLGPYRFLIAKAKAAAAHTLSPQEQRLADLLSAPLLNGWWDRYQQTVANLKVNRIETKEGALNPLKDETKIETDPDRAIRRAGFEAPLQAYASEGQVLAATLIDVARETTAIAQLHKYPSAPASIYASRLQLTEPQVRDMLDAIAEHADILKNYERLRVKQVSRATGIADVHSWDLALSTNFNPKPMSFPQARAALLDALAPLGPEYVSNFAWLLDPGNGALEISGGDSSNRMLGGFSVGYPGVPVAVYVQDFTGTPAAISTIVHEGGHAINRRLMNENGVSPFYESGPKFLSEAYAILNELLLLDELERTSNTLAAKVYYEEKFLDKLRLEVFTSAEEGSFEQAVYDGVVTGAINCREDLDKINADILNKYELLAPQESNLRFGWMKKRLLFEDPLYLVNYLYAALVACKLYEMAVTDPKNFQPRYLALLREGFDAPGNELLQKNMGFTLDSKGLLDGALQLMRQRSVQLSQLYEQMPLSHIRP